MRVVQLGPLPPPYGGVSTNLMAIHDLLRARGHTSSIVAITNSGSGVPEENIYRPRSAFQLLKLLFTLEFDVVHFHIGGEFGLRLAVLTFVCGMLPGKKSVVTFHSGGYASDAVKFAKPVSLRGIAFRSIDFLIGVNAAMLEMFRLYGVPHDRAELILPFALRRPDPAIAVDKPLLDFIASHSPLLLSVGGLEPEYSHSFLIDEMEEILQRFPNAGLMIVGSGSLEAGLRLQAAEKGRDQKIMIANDVEHDAALHLIEKADVMLRITQYDGDAISVREALFLNTPVIVTDNGMRPDGVELVKSTPTSEELANAIEAAMSKAPVTAENAAGLQNIEAVLRVYDDLLNA